MSEQKNVHFMLYKTDTPRLRSTTETYVTLSRFPLCYFEAIGQNHIHFWLTLVLKNSMT